MTIYCAELANLICKRVSSGEYLIHICAEEGMPERSTIAGWTMEHPEFREKFSSALMQRAETWGESMISDIEKTPAHNESLQKQKLLIDTKKWIMGKLLKTYADKVMLQGDKDNPIQLSLATALDQRIAAARAAPVIEHDSNRLPVIDVE